ncbi:MAG: squalene synthase HpnC [Solirubrobacteraceae bacterium]
MRGSGAGPGLIVPGAHTPDLKAPERPLREGRAKATGGGRRPGADIPTPQEVMGRAGQENFPVASRLLPAGAREHLLAIYGFARLTDELGDSLEGDRLSALDWLEGELDAAFQGSASHPLLRSLEGTIRACGLAPEPFRRLIEANREDQRRVRYERFEDLLSYCALSANPVGELVLGVLGCGGSERVTLSDAVCSGLQVVEHLQDVAEDRRRGRVYLPLEDMRSFGVDEEQLDASSAGPGLRELIAFEADRARALLLGGAPLLRSLRGRAKIAVAAYIGGGLAALDAIEAAGHDVLAVTPRAGRGARLLATLALLAHPPRADDGVSGGSPGADADGQDARAGAGAGVPRGGGRAASVDAAYRTCERITRREARNFYYGIRLLPPAKRRAMCAVYAFARRIDDVGDGALADDRRLVRLEAQAEELDALLAEGPATGAGTPEHDGAPLALSDPVLIALADARARFALPGDALRELVEGVRMDIVGTRYERFEELEVYCRRVAGGIGRLCLAIFGVRDERARAWCEVAADELGVAMQLTNILRDLREDAQRGRVYVPLEDIAQAGLRAGALSPEILFAEGPPPAGLGALVDLEATRARERFMRGSSLLTQLDRRSAACLLAMIGIYSRLLERIAQAPEEALVSRMALPRSEKAWTALRSVLGALA